MKTNNVISRIEAKYAALYDEKYRRKMDLTLQLAQDAAFLAASDTFQMGKGRAEKFGARFRDYVNQISLMVVEDSKDDPDYWHTKQSVDERMKQIVGAENFCPWEERYK